MCGSTGSALRCRCARRATGWAVDARSGRAGNQVLVGQADQVGHAHTVCHVVANLASLAHTGGGSLANIAVGIGALALAETRRAATGVRGDDVGLKVAGRDFCHVNNFHQMEGHRVNGRGPANVVQSDGTSRIDGALVDWTDERSRESIRGGGHRHGGLPRLKTSH